MRFSFTFLLLGLAASMLGCNETTETTYVDVGRACVSGAPDEPHSIEVNFPTCISSSCGEIVESTCEAMVSDNKLTITATATIIEDNGGGCTPDCQPVLAGCLTGPLPAGDYDLVFGNYSGALTVPATTADPTCVGNKAE
jgi:hypothetical protein